MKWVRVGFGRSTRVCACGEVAAGARSKIGFLRGAVAVFAALLASVWGPAALAGTLFKSDVSVGPVSVFRGVNDLRKLDGLFDEQSLAELFSTHYQPGVSAVVGAIDLRGLPATISYAAGSTELVFSVPVLGIDMRFDGSGRNLSQGQFADWLEGKRGSGVSRNPLLTRLLQGFVEYSPVDPIAGNPNSLQNKMFEADFALAGGGPFVADDARPEARARIRNGFTLGASFDHFVGETLKGQSYGIDFGYGFSFRDSRLTLVADLPLAFTSTESAKSYMLSFALGLQVRVNPWWNITPIVRLGGAGSIELGGLSGIISGGLASQMRCRIRIAFDAVLLVSSFALSGCVGFSPVNVPLREVDAHHGYRPTDERQNEPRGEILVYVAFPEAECGRRRSRTVCSKPCETRRYTLVGGKRVCLKRSIH